MWVVILQTESDVIPIYIGSSEKKANKIAAEKEDVDNGCYCYVCWYNKES